MDTMAAMYVDEDVEDRYVVEEDVDFEEEEGEGDEEGDEEGEEGDEGEG